jgi:phospholipid/cholesterol/gamma-HCH transport system ATP-binding protein
MSEENKIEIRNLHKAFGKKVVLDGIDLDIKKGESLVVIGGSGTGKSVLIKCIQGLLTPDEGSILVDGEEVVGIDVEQKEKLHSKMGSCSRAARCMTV